MKFKYLFLFGLASAALLAGCKEEEPVVTPSIEVKPEVLSFSAEGTSKTVSVTANGSWKATIDYDENSGWLSVTPESGDASDNAVTVEITAEENTASEARNATVTFTNSSAYVRISVTQGKAEEGGDTPDDEKEIVDATVAEFLAADPDDDGKLYRLTGTVEDIGVVSLMSFTLVDGNDEVQVPFLAVSAESSTMSPMSRAEMSLRSRRKFQYRNSSMPPKVMSVFISLPAPLISLRTSALCIPLCLRMKGMYQCRYGALMKVQRKIRMHLTGLTLNRATK